MILAIHAAISTDNPAGSAVRSFRGMRACGDTAAETMATRDSEEAAVVVAASKLAEVVMLPVAVVTHAVLPLAGNLGARPAKRAQLTSPMA